MADTAAAEYRAAPANSAHADVEGDGEEGETRKRGMEGFTGRWKGLHQPLLARARRNRRRRDDARSHRRRASARSPQGFTAHPNLLKILAGAAATTSRTARASTGAPARRWRSARSSWRARRCGSRGQDSRRGTFTQRHAVVVDFNTGAEYYPLANLDPKQASFDVYDSSLSEAAVMGFEYGYSLDDPALTRACGKRSSATSPTVRRSSSTSSSPPASRSGTVPAASCLLLPHAYEGQGPEHSSARLERFLQMCAEDNIQVAYPTTPAQYFHLLRRQVKRNFRKPLVVMTPKSLLRLTRPRPRPVDASSPPASSARCSTTPTPTRTSSPACSSVRARCITTWRRSATNSKTQAVAIVRLEQLYPWPEEQLAAVLGRYRRCREWVWVQEESQNMGGWSFAEPRLRAMNFPFDYVGRDASASPATGSHHVHEREQELIVAGAFAVTPPGADRPRASSAGSSPTATANR